MLWKFHGIYKSNSSKDFYEWGKWILNQPPFISRQVLNWWDWDTNSATKLSVFPGCIVFWTQSLAESPLKNPDGASSRNQCSIVLLPKIRGISGSPAKEKEKKNQKNTRGQGHLWGLVEIREPVSCLTQVPGIYVMAEQFGTLVGSLTVRGGH